MPDYEAYLYPKEFGTPRVTDGCGIPTPPVETDDQKISRECALLLGGLREGFAAAAQDAEANPMGAIGKLAIAGASGSLMSQALGAGGAYAILARGAASAMGLMTVAELTHVGRLTTLQQAMDDTWQSAQNFAANKTKVAGALGPLAFDALLMTAGGAAGAAYGCCNSSITGLQEWPHFTMTKDGFMHTFGDSVTYRTSHRGAELLLPNGETFRWENLRPFFRSNGNTTEFAGGSRLKIESGASVEFFGKLDNGRLNLKSDLKNDFHMAEYDRWQPGKPQTRQWERVYRMTDGTMLVQYPNSVYQITTPRGSGLIIKDNAIADATKVALDASAAALAPGAKAPLAARFTTSADGLPKAQFADGTEIIFGKDGKAHVKGLLKQEFQL